MANEQQSEYWNDSAGPKWVAAQESLDQALSDFTRELLSSAELDEGHSVLDVGCGTGASTVAACKVVGTDSTVTGIDLSRVMLEAARERASREGVAATFRQVDAQVEDFSGQSYNKVLSRFGVMFFDDPVAAFRNLRSTMRGDGSLTFVCWQAPRENEWITLPMSVVHRFVQLPPPEEGAPGPFAFADPNKVRSLIEEAGWKNVSIEPKRGSMKFGSGSVDESLQFMQQIGPLSRVLAEIESEGVRNDLIDALRDAYRVKAGPDETMALEGAIWTVNAQA